MTLKRTSNLKKGVRMWAVLNPRSQVCELNDTREQARESIQSYYGPAFTVASVIVKLAPRKPK